MGLMDKVKKILFDEDEVEVPIKDEELPEKPKREEKRERTEHRGFIEYHHGEEEIKEKEEDTIKEIKVPKEDDSKNTFNFPIDFEEELPSRSQSYAEVEPAVVNREEKPESIYNTRDYHIEPPVKKVHEEKDYHKLISEKEGKMEKKPFKVTPVISPVYGILEKDYKPDEVVDRKERILEEKDVPKKRTFGPVSYNDEPLPIIKPAKKVVPKEEQSLKEDLVELNTTISELIDESIRPQDIKEPVIEPDTLTEAGIEEEYIGHNSIEDAFETTSEFDQINSEDEIITADPIVESDEPQVAIDEILHQDDDNLSDTIETDLFNLIDSMYKSDDSEDE